MNKKTVIILVIVFLVLCCLVITTVIGAVLIWPKLFPTYTVSPTPSITLEPSMEITKEVTPIVKPTSISYCSPMQTGSNIIYPATKISQTKWTTNSFIDTFNNNANKWDLGQYETEYALNKEYIQNGKLCYDIQAKRSVFAKDTLFTQAITDFDISVEGFKSNGTKDVDYSLVFRDSKDDNHYAFGVYPYYQEYYFSVVVDDEWTDIIDYTYDENINTQNVNKLRVKAEGSKFSLYINDKLVKTITDTSITSGGNVGIGVALESDEDYAIVEFDNFNLKINDSK